MTKKQLIIRISLYLLVVVAIFSFLYTHDIKITNLSKEKIQALANDHVVLILLIMLVIMTLQNLFTFIPLIFVITLNITLFGFWKGYLYSTFCSVIGSTAIFLSIRYLFPNIFSSFKFNKYMEKIEANGFFFVLSARILPFLPTNLINIVSGLSTIKIPHFLIATTIGNLIYGLVLASASFSVMSATNQNAVLAIVIIVLILIFVLVRKFTKKQKDNIENGI